MTGLIEAAHRRHHRQGIPEFKVSAVKIERAGGHGDVRDDRDLTLHGGDR